MEDKQPILNDVGTSHQQPKTQWKSVAIMAVIQFVLAGQFSIYFASMWPYLRKIDKSADMTFYGICLAFFSFGQMLGSPAFGYLSSRMKTIRLSVFIGILISVLGNVVYISTESFTSNRKFIILVGRFLCGFGSGVSGAIRGYMATTSPPEYKARTIAIGVTSFSLGVTAGPVFQACLSPIGYPGIEIGSFHISVYTAPAVVSIIICVLSLILLFTVFKEEYTGLETEKKKSDPYFVMPKYDVKAALLCVWFWFALFFAMTNNETVESPYTIAVFNWTGPEAVLNNSIIMACSSSISFVIFLAFVIWGKRANDRLCIIAGLCMLCGFYIFTFPWPFYTGQMKFSTDPVMANLTNYTSTPATTVETTTTEDTAEEPGGCKDTMKWCLYTKALPLPVYLVAYPLFSIGFPCCNVAVMTLFAKIIGARRQGVMQSLMVMTGSFARMLGPLLISMLFDFFGPQVAWTMTAGVVATSIWAALIFYDRLVPLNMKPRLLAGEKIRYDLGVLYRL